MILTQRSVYNRCKLPVCHTVGGNAGTRFIACPVFQHVCNRRYGAQAFRISAQISLERILKASPRELTVCARSCMRWNTQRHQYSEHQECVFHGRLTDPPPSGPLRPLYSSRCGRDYKNLEQLLSPSSDNDGFLRWRMLSSATMFRVLKRFLDAVLGRARAPRGFVACKNSIRIILHRCGASFTKAAWGPKQTFRDVRYRPVGARSPNITRL